MYGSLRLGWSSLRWLEQCIHNAQVGGSIPPSATNSIARPRKTNENSRRTHSIPRTTLLALESVFGHLAFLLRILFLAETVQHRQGSLERELGFTTDDLAWIYVAYLTAYAVGQFGRLPGRTTGRPPRTTDWASRNVGL